MKCKFFRIRQTKGNKYFFCKFQKKNILNEECFYCKHKEFKDYIKMKKKSNKLKQLEQKRYSIFTSNLSDCFMCDLEDKKVKRSDLHEVYGGSNRQRSMKLGLVVPLCRKCHDDEEKILELRKICQQIYELDHTREEFIDLIGKSYLK